MLVQWRRLTLCLGLLAMIGLGSGCSGINASGSVSPASFILPGLGEAHPNPPSEPGEAQETLLVARTH